jgi:hypothetical protein
LFFPVVAALRLLALAAARGKMERVFAESVVLE